MIIPEVPVQKLLIITDTSPPDHYSHASPNAMTGSYGPRSIVLCAPQESAPISSDQCAFPKLTDDAAIG